MSKPTGKAARRQRGVALIMTLSILALMLIMAMSFSYTSKTDRVSAGISADLMQARLLCESGLSRVLAAMKFSYDPATTSGFADYEASLRAKVYPPTWGSEGPGNPFPFRQYGTSGQHYMVSTGVPANIDSAGLPDDLLVPDIGAFLAAAIPAGLSRWQHIRQDVNRTGAPPADWPVTGRFAYLILDESGKIDPTAAVTPDWEPFCMVHDQNNNGLPDSGDAWFYYDVDADGTWDASGGVAEGTEARAGLCLGEVRVPDEFRTRLPMTQLDLNGDGTPDLIHSRWFSLQHLFSGVYNVLPAPIENHYLTYAADSYDIEAWHGPDTSAPPVWKDWHRFDLSGTAWDSNKTDGVNGWDNLAVAPWTGLSAVQWLDSDPVEFWDPGTPGQVNPVPAAVPGGTGGIRCMRDLIPDQAQRYEVLASLIDYCDSNNEPTYGDIDHDGYYDFVGVEMSPYNNEVALHVAYGWRDHPVFGPTGVFSITCEMEAVNPYDAPGATVPNGGTLPNYSNQVYVQVRVTFDFGGNVPPGITNVITWEGTAAVPAHGYASVTMTPVPGSGSPFSNWNTDWHPDISLAVTEVVITMTAVDAAGDPLLVDYSRWTGNNTGTISAEPNIVAPPPRTAALQTDDPRCNTRADQWHWTFPNEWRPGGGVDDIGTKNRCVDLSPASDEEGVPHPIGGGDDPANACPADDSGLSTWFIRNGPMVCPWELGAIHRGEPWRTINLKSFSSGDARLLTQCKIGPWTITTGKFNANSPMPRAWEAVLSNLRRDALYYNPAPAGAPSYIDAAAVVSAMSVPLSHLTERGQIADVGALSDASLLGGTRDRERESVIGRIANLLTVRQNYFTVIVNGQSVKDLGGNNPGGDDVCEYESGKYCRVLAEQKIIATVYRDALTNRYRIDRIEYLEE